MLIFHLPLVQNFIILHCFDKICVHFDYKRVNQIFYKNSEFSEAWLLYIKIFQIYILYMFR